MDKKQENILIQMRKLNKAMIKAKEKQGESVVYSRNEVLDDAVITLTEESSTELVLFGVKNTVQIGSEIVEKLQNEKGFLFHTVDKMSERGRAIDVDLINPLTSKVMTGSSSGGCVNILRGINDIAIGTDGGGSVLAPAMSTGLFSIMGKGLGLKGNDLRTSTDDIKFVPGIGVISHSYGLCKQAIKSLVNIDEDIDIINQRNRKIRVAVPKKGSIILPNGEDMRDVLEKVIQEINKIVEIEEIDMINMQNRQNAIETCENIFNKNIDIIITAEGPIDLYSVGDSVSGLWGQVGQDFQNKSGKYLLKIANMIDATAITIPNGELGMGILIMGKKGIETGKIAIALGDIIKDIYSVPKLFTRYFIDGHKQQDKGFFRGGK